MTLETPPPRQALDFEVPGALEATEPLERRTGRARDQGRLLVAQPSGLGHRRFSELPSLLEAGDLVVVNTSATLPAALDARGPDGTQHPVHVSSPLDTGEWVVEVRRQDNRGPAAEAAVGWELQLPGGVRLTLLAAYPDRSAAPSRLWRALVAPHVPLVAYLFTHGRPIRYGGVRPLPLEDYQNVYATQPGSAEMASAGRPFTRELLDRLRAAGIGVADVLLHAGVSSPELLEPPYPERIAVSATTARAVNAARERGRRVVAVGTTVVRALESAADADGTVTAAAGWTSLVLGNGRGARVTTGLITGLHLPASSHLSLLHAVAGDALVAAAYSAALAEGYLWHEFGDSMLFLP